MLGLYGLGLESDVGVGVELDEVGLVGVRTEGEGVEAMFTKVGAGLSVGGAVLHAVAVGSFDANGVGDEEDTAWIGVL